MNQENVVLFWEIVVEVVEVLQIVSLVLPAAGLLVCTVLYLRQRRQYGLEAPQTSRAILRPSAGLTRHAGPRRRLLPATALNTPVAT